MLIVEKIKSDLHRVLAELGIVWNGNIHLEHPQNFSHGDYSTNIAMVLAKTESKNPQKLAKAIAEKISLSEIISVDVAFPGFINIRLSDEFFYLNGIKAIHAQKDSYGWNELWKGKKILVEHSSPNLFKAFHIGHMMNNTIGESIARLCRTSGAEVIIISYPSDVSLGIGKAVWRLLQYGVEKLDEFETLDEKIKFLGQCYTQGTQAYADDKNIESRVREITQDIYEHRDTPAYEAYKIGRDFNLQYFINITARLGSVFDGFIFESETGILGKQIVKEHTPDIYTESNGAIIYKGEQDGLHTRVFINKEENPTYEAKDIGLLKLKFDRYNPDLSVFITDTEQGPYFKVVAIAAGKINRDWQEKTIHKTHGRMQFKGKKMSSRLGNTPLVSDILDILKDKVIEHSSGRKLSKSQIDMITVASVKYTVLRNQLGKNINFDPETSLSFEGDSGPYLQYTYARSSSMIQKALDAGINIKITRPENWETTDIERYLYRFQELVEIAFKELAPHIVVTYITELAQLFNSWYGNTKIVDVDDVTSGYKLALTQSVAQVIKNGLWILGIDTPDKM